jgi:hypothetical protein
VKRRSGTARRRTSAAAIVAMAVVGLDDLDRPRPRSAVVSDSHRISLRTVKSRRCLRVKSCSMLRHRPARLVLPCCGRRHIPAALPRLRPCRARHPAHPGRWPSQLPGTVADGPGTGATATRLTGRATLTCIHRHLRSPPRPDDGCLHCGRGCLHRGRGCPHGAGSPGR